MERLCDKSSSHSTTHNSNMITEEMYEIDIPIYIEEDWIRMSTILSPEDTMPMNIWNSSVGETLKCMQEPSKEVYKNETLKLYQMGRNSRT